MGKIKKFKNRKLLEKWCQSYEKGKNFAKIVIKQEEKMKGVMILRGCVFPKCKSKWIFCDEKDYNKKIN